MKWVALIFGWPNSERGADSNAARDCFHDGILRFGIEFVNHRIQCVDQSFVVVVLEVIVQLDSVLCKTVEQLLLVESARIRR